jgi:hypothetical protein
MLYNENITYDQPGLSYVGTIIINVEGLLDPIIISNVNVAITTSQDYSNATTVAVLSYDIYPEGIITIQATQSQANALVEAVTSSGSGTAEITLLQF